MVTWRVGGKWYVSRNCRQWDCEDSEEKKIYEWVTEARLGIQWTWQMLIYLISTLSERLGAEFFENLNFMKSFWQVSTE